MIKINLGCGKKYKKGYINTDFSHLVKADKYFDLDSLHYPFKNNSTDKIIMDNVLEHLNNIPQVLKEIHRILKPDGILEIVVPYAKSDGAYHDPTHRHFFTEKSMDYFTSDSDYNFYTDFSYLVLEKRLRNANTTRLSKLRYFIPGKFLLKYFLFNMYDEVYFKLKAMK